MSARNSQRPTVKRFIVKVQIDASGTQALIYNQRRDVMVQAPLSDEDAAKATPLDKWFQYATLASDGSIALEPDVRAPSQEW